MGMFLGRDTFEILGYIWVCSWAVIHLSSYERLQAYMGMFLGRDTFGFFWPGHQASQA